MQSISPVAFTLFSVSVHWYGILIAAGILCALLLADKREKQLGLPKDTGMNIVLVALPAAIICARLYFVAFSWDMYADDLLQILNIRNGGLAFYGGLIGGIIAGILYGKMRHLRISAMCDLAAPSIAIGQAFGRWGNFFNQEAYGAHVLQENLHFFPMSVYIQSQQDWFYATFFYESTWCLLICVAILVLERNKFFHRSGDMMFWYGLLYAAERVSVEALRTDSLYIGGARISQLLSACALVVITIIFLCRIHKKTILMFTAMIPALILCIIALSGISISFPWLILLSAGQIVCSTMLYRKTPKTL